MPTIGRRTGDKTPRLGMIVSPEMRALRIAQTHLNHFLWTTEICYGHVLAQASTHFADLQKPISSTTAPARAHVWFPNSQGRNRFRESTGHFLTQTQENTTELYRLVLVGYYARHEEYLDNRALDLRDAKLKTWGPFVRSLASSVLREAPVPLLPKSVLCADVCRLVRNLIVHEPTSPLPVDLNDARVRDWSAHLFEEAVKYKWSVTKESVKEAMFQVVGQVSNHLEQALKEGECLPPELFYLLFTFTNLDHLACQVEEALLPPDAGLPTWVTRPAERIRRQDLIVRQAVTADSAKLV
jgi:hypothetical protein